ncbi:MAG: hypothetical protein ACLVBW_03345 [Lachnospiraceae bacterium]
MLPTAKCAVPHAKYAVPNKVIPKLSPELSTKRCYTTAKCAVPHAKYAAPHARYAAPPAKYAVLNAKYAVSPAKYAAPTAKYAVPNKVIPKLSPELSTMDLSQKNGLEK